MFKVINVMQDSLVHSSGMRVKSVSRSAVLSFCRDALGSFDKWLRAAAISITTFFCPPPSGFQVVGFSFWDFPNKWGGWRPRKTNNKASEILTSDSRMRKLSSQAIRWQLSTDLLKCSNRIFPALLVVAKIDLFKLSECYKNEHYRSPPLSPVYIQRICSLCLCDKYMVGWWCIYYTEMIDPRSLCIRNHSNWRGNKNVGE